MAPCESIGPSRLFDLRWRGRPPEIVHLLPIAGEPASAPWRYSKAGVITSDLVPLTDSPRALFGALDREQGGALMAAMDARNARFGRGSVVPARAGLLTKRPWSTKCEMRTPRCTTRPAEVPTVSAAAAA